MKFVVAVKHIVLKLSKLGDWCALTIWNWLKYTSENYELNYQDLVHYSVPTLSSLIPTVLFGFVVCTYLEFVWKSW